MSSETGTPLGSGRFDGAAHRFRVRVYYEDTDAGGIVYHSNYLNYAERARTELLRFCGIGQDKLRAEQGAGFAVRRCEIDYRAPARLDDELEVCTVLSDMRGARVSAEQTIYRIAGGCAEADWLARLQLTLACINNDGRPVRLPDHVRSAFQGVLASP